MSRTAGGGEQGLPGTRRRAEISIELYAHRHVARDIDGEVEGVIAQRLVGKEQGGRSVARRDDRKLGDAFPDTLSLPDQDDEDDTVKIDNPLQQLVEHFMIPEVHDLANLNPEIYQRNVDLLQEIENIVNA